MPPSPPASPCPLFLSHLLCYVCMCMCVNVVVVIVAVEHHDVSKLHLAHVT